MNGLIRSTRHRGRSVTCEAMLQRLAGCGAGVAAPDGVRESMSGYALSLDAKTQALVRIAAVIATGAGSRTYRAHVADAITAGASEDDVVGTLVVVSSTVGMAKIVASAVDLALGLGYDVGAAFEGVDEPDRAG